MRRDLTAMAGQTFDLLVIGGGIFGAGVACDAARTREAEPGLSPDGLSGAIRYYDCQEDDARLCLDNIIHAVDRGTVCANYCELKSFAAHDGRVVAATVTDRLGGESFDIRA